MAVTHTRYVLRRRSDGLFFHSPTDGDPEEWRPAASTAHQWLTIEMAQEAALRWMHHHKQELHVITLTLREPGQYLEYSTWE